MKNNLESKIDEIPRISIGFFILSKCEDLRWKCQEWYIIIKFIPYCIINNWGLSLIEIVGYVDPGSATALIALILGAIAGAGMTLKMYWFKIKHKITRN